MKPHQKENSRRWYQKVKKDPVRYAAILARQRLWQRKYRQSKSKKYLMMEMRRRARRALDPFPHRERNRIYYEKLRANPQKYQAYLERCRRSYRERMVRLKADVAKYRQWRADRMVYHRYYRIMKEAALCGREGD